ncbi:hypothetical protein Glove_228g32 [Diversispora epigaea]|uniref:Uncharacterized protein n=1 Tax=Diversispora epigaea TaxID=1348612 RepID=A0A397IGE2_9GLOM|nr:hypothetical protein Glove_228g32 [Diversispora epigaea]
MINIPLNTSGIEGNSLTSLVTHVAKCFANDVETVSGQRTSYIPLNTSGIEGNSLTSLVTHVAKCFANDVETVSGQRTSSHAEYPRVEIVSIDFHVVPDTIKYKPTSNLC